MRSEPLVSAIIIFLNGEKYLEEAIQSVITQTYQNWELLLVDDGSTDNSTAMALNYEQQWPGKIKYLQHDGHQNRGMSATRNLGIKHAKGEFIGFLDADDVWLPNKLEEQVHIFHKYPQCRMIYGRTQIWYSWSGKHEDQNKDYFMPLGVKPDSVIQPPKILLLLLKNKVQSPTTCNVLIKKNVFETVGMFQEDFRGMFEDMAFLFKATLCIPIYVSNRFWARYRQHDESCCSVSAKTKADKHARQRLLEWFRVYLDEKKNHNLKIRFALYRENFSYQHKSVYKFLQDPVKSSKRFLRRYFPQLQKPKRI
ncbi:MAG: glycosyltransferase family 2 protein [Chitinophagaceae bacterium]|nr:glycosyltransferase family 2 protein [Chitinophagaceae bacterium]